MKPTIPPDDDSNDAVEPKTRKSRGKPAVGTLGRNAPGMQTTYTSTRRKGTVPGQDFTVIESRTEGPKQDKKKRESDQALLNESLTIFKSIADDQNEIDIRTKALEELRFKEGEQWPLDILERRRLKGRPIVTINKVKPAVRIICNDQRQNRAGIKVLPMDGAADKKVAEILQGTVRHIEYNSMSDIAVDTACEAQVTFGFGYMRLLVDYANPFSMDQEIFIKRVKDSFSVYCGAASEPDYSDMDDCFITEDLTPQQFAMKYPGSEWSEGSDFTGIGDRHRGWGTRGSIRLCERYWREYEKKTLCRMTDGSSMLKDQIPAELMDSMGIKEERETEIPVVYWMKFSAVEILHPKQRLDGIYIPVIPVLGDDTIVDGKRIMSGVVRGAMDPSMQYNYFRSLMTETLGLAPKAPYIMAEGQNENRETMWNTANSENYSVLFYKPVTVAGQIAPPPQRQQSEPPIQAMVEAAIHYEADIKATTMVNDSKLGARSNETSGAAINARKAQSDVSNYNYIDNRNRALRHMGRQIIDLIPHVYSTRNIMRIIGEDGEASTVPITHQPGKPAMITDPADDDRITPDDIQAVYNIGVGLYDVAIGVGDTYLSKRAEAAEMMLKLTNNWPDLLKIAGDVIFEDLDIPGAKKISKRLYKALPPMLQDKEDNTPIPPKVKQAFEQMQQQMEQLTQMNAKLQEMLETEAIKNKAILDKTQMEVDAKNKAIEAKAATEMASIQQQDIAAHLQAQVSMMDANQKAMEAKLDQRFQLVTSLLQHMVQSSQAEQAHRQTIEQQAHQADQDRQTQAEAPVAPTAQP